MENPRVSCSDIISSLPDNLLESILIRLPIRDAARTCVLSRRWRNSWNYMPHLVFDDVFRNSMRNRSSERVIRRIDQIVSTHLQPVIKFSLSIYGLISSPEIYPLINHVLGKGVQDLILHLWGWQKPTLPSELYTHQQLTSLNLRWCLFEPPPMFTGFPRLISLVLSKVSVTSGVLSSLISSCPLLERLTLESCGYAGILEIVALNLKSVCFKGILRSVRLINVPSLAMVSILLGLPTVRYSVEGITHDLVGILNKLLVVKNFHLDYYYIQCLTARKFQTAFVPLEVLKLSDISFEHSEVKSILAFIGNCPNLRKLIIEVCYRGDVNRVSLQRFYDICQLCFPLNKIKEIEILSLNGSGLEMEFIKFVLATSPYLEKMIIVLDLMLFPGRAMGILIELGEFQKLSPNAAIIMKDPTGNWM